MFACLYDLEHTAAVRECAQAFSPLVEETAPGAAVLEIEGLERLFGSSHEMAAAMARRAAGAGFEPRIAIASNPDAALCAARGFAGISIVPEGDEAKYLGSLPLALLEPPPEIAETLARWGIRRFRDLAALPARGLVERLGQPGVRLHQLARGVFERPLVPLEEPLAFLEELELEYPVEQLEPLAFLLARMLNGLVVRLGVRSLATTELRLELRQEDGAAHARTLRLPVPMLDARAFLKLLQLDLAAHPPGAAVVRARLEAVPVKPRVAQHGLFIPLAPEPEKMEVTLARLEALAGEGNVGSPELVDTHRPDAFRMRRFSAGEAGGGGRAAEDPVMALRLFRPPRPARVEVANSRPTYVYTGSLRGNVVSLAGPWRTSGDWWTTDPWARDEWDVALAGGVLCRIACEHATGRWFLAGCYD